MNPEMKKDMSFVVTDREGNHYAFRGEFYKKYHATEYDGIKNSKTDFKSLNEKFKVEVLSVLKLKEPSRGIGLPWRELWRTDTPARSGRTRTL